MSSSSPSVFSLVPSAPVIEIFELSKRFRADESPLKVDLGVGAYRTNEGKPWILPVVREEEKAMASDPTLDHEYLTILGLPAFSAASARLLLGAELADQLSKDGRLVSVQCLSGTGSLRVGADFLSKILGFKSIRYSDPSWPNHGLVFKHAGFTDIATYRYWNPSSRSLDFEGMICDLESAEPKTVIVLHACAHNPTGVDPTREQWAKIADVIQARQLFPFFDCAYQGFASGDLDKDAWTVRYFVQERGLEVFAAQSYAKNFGLYNERAGNLVIVTKASDSGCMREKISGQVTLLVRGNYSNPPNHGARVVVRILSDGRKYEEWKECIRSMSGRIQEMRKGLRSRLECIKTPGTWDHITDQIGMFSYTGLTPDQVNHLVEKCHIYLTRSGRISICGLNTNNLDHVATSIKEAITLYPSPAL